MKIASVANVKAKFSAYVKASGRGPVVITRNGRAVAAIIPLARDEDLERLMLGYSPKLRAILDAARGRIKRGTGLEHERFWRDLQSAGRNSPKRNRA